MTDIEKIRDWVSKKQSEKRFSHTLGVERECVHLAEIFVPDKKGKLQIAALLHDITKELKSDKQIELFEKYGLEVSNSYILSPKLFHAQTGAYLAKERFPELVDDEMFGAIKYHTTGRRGMNMAEIILYLADYIEDTRTFEDCVKLREFFYSGINNAENSTEKYRVLIDTMILSFDMTVKILTEEGAPIAISTVDARNAFIEERINLSKFNLG